VNNAQLARAVLQQIAYDLRAAVYEEPDDDSGSLDPAASTGGEDVGTDTGTGAGDGTGVTSTGDDTSTADDSTSDLTSSTVASVPGLYGNQSELRINVRGNFPHPLRYDAIVAAGSDPLVENLVSVDQVVTYYLRTSSAGELAGTPLESPLADQNQQTMILVRRVQKRAEAEYDSALGGSTMQQAGEQLLSDRVVALEFAYHDGYDWIDSWDSELDGGLPLAVQMTVTIADSSDQDSVITLDNIFQTKVALPTAVVPDDTASMEGF
jgi:hypothetical protein